MTIGFTPIWAFLWLVLAPAPQAPAPHIADLHVVVDGNRALVSFDLEGGFDSRFTERVESGLPTGFVYRLELVRERRHWYDKSLDTNTLQVVAMYDSMARDYLVNYKLGGKLVESRMVRELAELEQSMTHIENLPAFSLEAIPATVRLHVRAKAELGAKTILSFIPAKITTDWAESNRFRSTNPP